jgi:hypothetical protein
MRIFMDNPVTEMSIMGVVFAYAIIIFIDLGFSVRPARVEPAISWSRALLIRR